MAGLGRAISTRVGLSAADSGADVIGTAEDPGHRAGLPGYGLAGQCPAQPDNLRRMGAQLGTHEPYTPRESGPEPKGPEPTRKGPGASARARTSRGRPPAGFDQPGLTSRV